MYCIDSYLLNSISYYFNLFTYFSQQQFLNLLTKDEALTILSYTFEQPYHIPSTFHQWLLSFTKKSIQENQEEIGRGGEKREEKREEKRGEKRGEERGGKDYYRLLVEGLGKLPRKVVKVEGMEEEVGVVLVGDLSFDCKEGEGVVFPLLASFYEVYFLFISFILFYFILFYFILLYYFILFYFLLFSSFLFIFFLTFF